MRVISVEFMRMHPGSRLFDGSEKSAAACAAKCGATAGCVCFDSFSVSTTSNCRGTNERTLKASSHGDNAWTKNAAA